MTCKNTVIDNKKKTKTKKQLSAQNMCFYNGAGTTFWQNHSYGKKEYLLLFLHKTVSDYNELMSS